MRLFLAIHLSDDVREQVAAMQGRLKESGADVKWVETENLHLTVKFIGDQEEALLPDIEAVCEEIASSGTPFRVRVRGASFFPKRGPLKTLWVGVPEGAEPWKTLVRAAEEPLLPFGVVREGGLTPHVTLGRVRSERNVEPLREAMARETATDCGAQDVTEIALVQSTLDPRGAIYKDVRRWPLQTPDIVAPGLQAG
jgi:RNA 2',3'-cyclic 3'-phosphodiesterase